MNQEKVNNIIRQILVLVGTALVMFGVDAEIVEMGKEIVFLIVGVIFEIIAFVGLIKQKPATGLSVASNNNVSVLKGAKDVFLMRA